MKYAPWASSCDRFGPVLRNRWLPATSLSSTRLTRARRFEATPDVCMVFARGFVLRTRLLARLTTSTTALMGKGTEGDAVKGASRALREWCLYGLEFLLVLKVFSNNAALYTGVDAPQVFQARLLLGITRPQDADGYALRSHFDTTICLTYSVPFSCQILSTRSTTSRSRSLRTRWLSDLGDGGLPYV